MLHQKTTFRASPDLAFIKYWGKKDKILRLPENGSVSMIVGEIYTTTTVEFLPKLKQDEIEIQGEKQTGEFGRISKHLDRIRKIAQVNCFAKVVSHNNFPKSTGLSSSGSGFAALTYATTRALGLKMSERDLSILARQGSGTACRCVCGGFVEWLNGNSSASSYSHTIYPASHWDLRDLIVVVDEKQKQTSSSKGHETARTSYFFSKRLERIDEKISLIKKAIKYKNFQEFGEIVEAETLEFHSMLMTSSPSMIFWHPTTLAVMLLIRKLRTDGVLSYFSINTGHNVHVLTLPKYESSVMSALQSLPGVKKVILSTVGEGPRELTEHLF